MLLLPPAMRGSPTSGYKAAVHGRAKDWLAH